MVMMLWKGEGRAYLSKRGSFTLDCSRNARQAAAGWAGSMVQVVQPWRELDFSAPDDDFPLTTLLTCVSTEQLADRWPGRTVTG